MDPATVTELPTTIVGLIAFIFLGNGFIIWRLQKAAAKAAQDQLNTFMGYIETKNHNLEKATTLFVESTEKKNKQFEIMLSDHDKRHGEMMDDMAARLESSLPPKRT